MKPFVQLNYNKREADNIRVFVSRVIVLGKTRVAIERTSIFS